MITRRFVLSLIIFLPLLFSGSAFSDEDRKPTEYEVKAAYIYNFAKFVRWPVSAVPGENRTIGVCVLGDDPFGPYLSAIAGKSAADRKIDVRGSVSPQDVRRCEIVFISGSEAGRLPQIMRAISGLPVLTVSDTDGFAEQGVMINFYMKDKTVRFEINAKAVTRGGLRISSNLLRIAKIVGEP